MGFIKKFKSDPLGQRVHVLIYGEEGIGKTHLVLELVRRYGDYVVLFSLDRGDLEVRMDPDAFEGKLAKAHPNSLRSLRSDMAEAKTILAKLAKSVPRSKIWVVVDTVTHLQSKLLAEARKINVANPTAQDSRADYIRDAVVEMDWGINLGHMTEVADFLTEVKANVVVLALAKPEKEKREETGRMIPAISGQSSLRFRGDADTIAFLTKDKNGERYLSLGGAGSLGKNRGGGLSEREPADLKLLQRKILGIEEPEPAALPASTKNDGASAETPAP